MKVLQVNCVYNKGSTGKIMYDIHTYLKKHGHSSVICYGRGEKTEDAGVYKTCGELYAKLNNLWSRASGLMYGGCFFSTNKLISKIKKENPDVVHLHCLNGYFVNIYRLVKWLKNSKIPTVLTFHAEFMHTANCAYAFDCDKWKTGCGKCPRLKKETRSWLFDRTNESWRRMKKAFEGFEELTVVSVSPWLMGRAKQSPIFADKEHKIVLNGLNTGVFSVNDSISLKEKLGLTGDKIVFHATSSLSVDPNHIKGGYYVLKMAEMMPDVKFVIAGNYADGLQVPQNVILLGNISNMEKLAKLYSMADVTLIASKKETFSMIVAESLCCGTPVVGFEAGAPEQIALSEFSRFVKYGDINALHTVLNETLNLRCEKEEVSKAAKSKYSKERMAEEYFEIYENRVG